jgi:hypothetical protein
MLTRRTLLTLTLLSAVLAAGTADALARQEPTDPPDMTVDAAARREVIDALFKRLNASYVFPETAAKMEQDVRERARRGEYEQITSAQEFARKLTSDLQSVSRDKHLRVRYSHRPLPENGGRREPSAEEREQFRRDMARMNYGFEKVERLPGNIGYVDFRGFMAPELGRDTVASVFSFLANTDALIIDLRRNGGGSPEMVALISSYLFGPDPVHLNSLYWREGDRTEEFWTLKEVAGRRYGNKDVYVLTSNYTFSAAEEFTYNLKSLKRATIVGETTGGGAHPGGMHRLHPHFGVFIPSGRAINPVTRTNWEGTGVEPDVKVPADRALKAAHLSAVKKQAERETNEELKAALGRLAKQLQGELDEPQAKK